MIVNDFIKLTLAQGGAYGVGDYYGEKGCSVVDNSVVIQDSPGTFLYTITGDIKIIRYHGYITGNNSIAMVDDDNNVLSSYTSDDVTTDIELIVPDGCAKIYLPCAKDYVSNYYIQTFSTEYLDVTNYVDNWENLEVVLSRDNTSGVISEVSFEMDFVLAAREWLKNIFDATGLYSRVMFSIHKRENYTNDYSLVKEMMLDFSSYQLTKDRIRISSSNNTLAEIINSEGKTEYEIPVKEICNEKKWNYSRIKFLNNAMYQMADFTIEENVSGYLAPTTITTSVELSPGSEHIDFVNQRLAFPGESDFFPSFLLENVSTEIVQVNVKIKSNITCSYSGLQRDVRLQLVTESVFGAITSIDYTPFTMVSDGVVTHIFNLDVLESFQIWPGRKLQLRFYFPEEVSNPKFSVDQEEFMVYFYNQASNIDIDVIHPQRLIQRYLDEMSGVSGLFHVSIDWQEESFLTMIVAADSIRQYDDAKLHGKPNDFFDWMRVLGYEYEIDGNELTFKRRDEFYRDTVALSMREDEIADLIVKADSEYAYTSIEIGFEKQDYDRVNGRLEVNGTFNYTTGYITREDNKLSLISPYRADSVGIEYLAQDSDKNTTDKESDNDVFFVALVDGEKYTEYRDVVIKDRQYDIELFNAVFSPYFLIHRNESLIGINSSLLKFRSTNMSRTGKIISGETVIDPYVDVSLNTSLFRPIIYNFAAGSHKDMPVIRNGYVAFVWDGEEYAGFIKEIRKNYARETETTWELFAKNNG